MKILIVDDFEMIRAMLKNTLEDLGFQDLHQAEDGSKALESIKKASDENKPFDLVFADWNMPVMTGLELLQECKSDERFKSMPFIMVTAEADRSYVMKALMTGASDYVIKPFSPEAISKKIENISKNVKKVG